MNVVGHRDSCSLYFGESVLIVMLVSMLLAFILCADCGSANLHSSARSLSAGIAILLLFAALCGVVYFSYNQATTLVHDLPKYVSRVREEARVSAAARNASKFWLRKREGCVNVRPATDWARPAHSRLRFGERCNPRSLLCSIPRLLHAGLAKHVRSATVMLFPLENRNAAYVTLGQISAMVRSFMVGNLLIGYSSGQ